MSNFQVGIRSVNLCQCVHLPSLNIQQSQVISFSIGIKHSQTSSNWKSGRFLVFFETFPFNISQRSSQMLIPKAHRQVGGGSYLNFLKIKCEFTALTNHF